MSVELTTPNWDELMRALNDLEQRVRRKALVRALEAGIEVVAGAIGRAAPRSAVPRGPGTGKTQGWRTGRHAADEVLRGKAQVTEFAASASVGWDTKANDPHFYMKFAEFGTSSIDARPFMEFATDQAADQAGEAMAAELEKELSSG